MNNVAIIGTGRLGTRLAEQILLDATCDCLFLANRSKPRLRGTIESLQIWKHLLGIASNIRELEWDRISQIELVVLAVKEHYDPRDLIETEELPDWLPHDLRYVGLSRDILIIKDICLRLREYRGVILVLTNPVDVVTTFVQKWVPSATVLGAGLSLDHARSTYFLSRKNEKLASEQYLLGGEHGTECVPLFSLGSSSLQSERTQAEIKESIAEASAIGFEIVKNLGYTVQDCAVVFSRDIEWILSSETDQARSFSCWFQKACIGWPLAKSNSGVRRLSVNDSESRALSIVEDRIHQIFLGGCAEWFEPQREEQ